MKTERIAVLGAGSWGATLAMVLAEKGHSVSLWEFDPAAAKSLDTTRRLSVLPELKLPTSVDVTSNLSAAIEGRPVLVSAVPSQFVRSTMKAARSSKALAKDAVLISASKGLEDKTLHRMSEVVLDELGWKADQIAVLSGPSHAEEVCRHLPTATVAASTNASLSACVQTLFSQEYFRVYAHNDVVGVELGGALKNVFAIACGVSDGLGFGDNTKAAIMTRGLNEMAKVGVKRGGELLTFFGLAGMGDLIVTCLSRHSRNRLLGEKIGQGKTPKQALFDMTMVSEGYKTAPAARALANQLGVECPLINEICQVLYAGKNPRTSLHDLMERETYEEWKGLEKR